MRDRARPVRRAVYGTAALLAWVATFLVWLDHLLEGGVVASFTGLLELFTTVTVLGLAWVCTWVALRPEHAPPWRGLAHLTVLSMGLLAFGVNALLLGARVGPGLAGAVDAVQHYVLPLGLLVAWAIVGPRFAVAWRAVPAVALVPAAWVAYALARGWATGEYPYGFLDVADRGLGPVLVTAAQYLAVVVAVAAVLVAVDRSLPAARPRRSTSART